MKIEEMTLDKLKTKQALFDETIDSLATFASEEVLFAVYEKLLRKYGLIPSRGTRSTPPLKKTDCYQI